MSYFSISLFDNSFVPQAEGNVKVNYFIQRPLIKTTFLRSRIMHYFILIEGRSKLYLKYS